MFADILYDIHLVREYEVINQKSNKAIYIALTKKLDITRKL